MAYNPQTAALNRTGKCLGFTQCPGCGSFGCVYEAYDPAAIGTGWTKWCYRCGWKETCERRVDREAREQQIRANNRKIAELQQRLKAMSRSGQEGEE